MLMSDFDLDEDDGTSDVDSSVLADFDLDGEDGTILMSTTSSLSGLFDSSV